MSRLSALAGGLALGLAMQLGAAGAAWAEDVTINALFMKQAAYSEDNIRAMIADFEAAHAGIKINPEFVAYEALHDKIVAAQGAGSSGYDVVLFDVIWPAEFGSKGFLQDVTARIPAEYEDQIFPGAWTTVNYDGKRWGMPWILDTKYLYFNKDMLAQAGVEPPKTWEELLVAAKAVKDKGLVEYPIVWSWSQSEAMICDYTTLVGANQGTFFGADGKPNFDQGGSLDAVTYMKASLDQGLTNPNSREYFEEDVRKVFSAGQAAFAMNWTYMYNLANDPAESQVAGKVGVVPAPGVNGKTVASAVNGSMGLGITAGSAHPEEAWSFISFITSAEQQNKYAKLSLPIWKASYDLPDVTAGQEELVAAAFQSINVMFARPSTPNYPELSAILQKRIQEVLLGSSEPAAALKAAADEAARLR